jgi:hypothetical protein
MYTLPAKTPTEAKLCTFDFATEAVAGSVLSAPSIAKSVLYGTDPAAAGLTVGAAVATDLQVQALVSGGLNGVTYQLTCTATADNGEVHQILARLAIDASAA